MKTLFKRNKGWNLIGIPYEPDVTMNEDELFFAHENVFDTIQATHQDKTFQLDIISKEGCSNITNERKNWIISCYV